LQKNNISISQISLTAAALLTEAKMKMGMDTPVLCWHPKIRQIAQNYYYYYYYYYFCLMAVFFQVNLGQPVAPLSSSANCSRKELLEIGKGFFTVRMSYLPPNHHCRRTYHYTHNHFTALFPGPPGSASARRELLDFMV